MKERAKAVQIYVGFMLGELTVIEKTAEKKNNYPVWKCRCSCGNEILTDTRSLRRGSITSCGCKPRVKNAELAGQRFGALLCIEATELRDESRKILWSCRCDCGKDCLVSGTDLCYGYKKSCGCQEQMPYTDLTAQRFGKLTVLSYAGSRNYKNYWPCRCDCGEESTVEQWHLQSGKSRSCGCLSTLLNYKSAQQSGLNRLLPKNNSSGHPGVYLRKKDMRWIAQISYKKKNYFLGSFRDISDAIKLRQEAEENYDLFLDWYRSMKSRG